MLARIQSHRGTRRVHDKRAEEAQPATASPDVERQELDAAVTTARERLARAQRAAGAGLWDWDIASGHMDWSPELFALFGLDPAVDTASFDAWGRTLHPDDAEEASARVTAAVADHAQLDSEYRIVRPDGEVRWIQALGNTSYDGAGAPLKMAGICVDITRRKRAELSRAASDSFSRQVIESAGEGIVVYGPDMRYQVWNPFMEELTGLRAEDVIGRHPMEMLPGLEAIGVMARIERALAGELTEPAEVPIVVPGRTGWVIDSSTPLRDQDGEIIGVIATIHDITARRLAEEASVANARLVTESQRAAGIGSYRADFEQDRWWSSEVLDELFGIGAGYPRTVPAWIDLIHPDDREDMTRYLAEEVIGKGRPFNHEYRIVRRSDGVIRWVSGLGEVTLAEDGTGVTLIGTIQDITDRRRAADEHARLQVQLQQAQRLESIGRLAGGVAHDFNNMLGAIIGYAELALERVDPADPVHGDLEEIHKAASRSAELTRQLLTYARRQATTPRVIDLNATIEAQLRMLRRLLGEDILLEWVPDPEAGQVNIDPSQVDRILTNLCINARDASGPAGRIVIETHGERLDEGACAGRVRVARGHRQRARDGRGHPGQRLRAVLHDQGRGRGHRARPRDDPRDGRPRRGLHRRGERARDGHDVPDPSPPGCRSGRSCG
jgi:PAS domain S-box-containing protein